MRGQAKSNAAPVYNCRRSARNDRVGRSRALPAGLEWRSGHTRSSGAPGLLPDEAYQLIITGSMVSIALNPLLFRAADKAGAARHPAQPLPAGD